jgi:hypothetical protein
VIASRLFKLKAVYWCALAFSIATGAYSLAAACEPAWVRTVVPSRYDSAFAGKVTAVDWLSSKISVTPIKRISGPTPHKTDVRFERWPWQCSHQTFHVGQIVDVFVFNDGVAWAHPTEQINFGQNDISAALAKDHMAGH